MRAITVLCTSVALFALSAAAHAGCREVAAPPVNKRIVGRVQGFEPVRVVFTADRSDATKTSNGQGDQKLKIGEEKFRFWIQGHVNVLFDRFGWVRTVYHCTLGAGRTEPKDLKTFVEVRYKTIANEGEEHSGFVGMLIPQAVANAQPAAGITYDSGNELVGKWERTQGDKGVPYLQLTISAAE